MLAAILFPENPTLGDKMAQEFGPLIAEVRAQGWVLCCHNGRYGWFPSCPKGWNGMGRKK